MYTLKNVLFTNYSSTGRDTCLSKPETKPQTQPKTQTMHVLVECFANTVDDEEIEAVQETLDLFKDRFDIDSLEINGWPIVLFAVRHCQKHIVKLLIEAGGKVDQIATSGPTAGCSPLLLAARHGNIEMVDMLIKLGAKLQHKQAITVAIAYEHCALAMLLCGHFTSGRLEITNKRTFDGSPIGDAVMSRDIDFINTLLVANCREDDFNDSYVRGDHPLVYAAREGYLDCVQALLQGGISPDSATVSHKGGDQTCTALAAAAHLGRVDIVKALLVAGARKQASLVSMIAKARGDVRICQMIQATKEFDAREENYAQTLEIVLDDMAPVVKKKKPNRRTNKKR